MLRSARAPSDSVPEPDNRAILPTMIEVNGVRAPAAPQNLRDTGVDLATLLDLALKAAYTVPQFNTEWAVRKLHLPQPLVAELLEQLHKDHLLDVLGSAGPFGFRYAIGQVGRERAQRLLEISGYIGPAPVSLAAYTSVLEEQLAHAPPVSRELVEVVLSGLVLPPHAVELAGLAVSSRRSLFLFGPPGNGKTSVGRLLHNAFEGDLWIPHCIGVDGNIIRIFDSQVHQRVEWATDQPWQIDQRWARVFRPLIVAGGEMTLESLELTYSPGHRFYEAPMHVKANGGTFLIDDFGRQHIDPHHLLNRWIIPLEHQIDYMTLRTGQKIQMPLRQMLIVATNLRPEDVTDPAFLRRMGYRLHLDNPTPERYSQIFQRYAARLGTPLPAGAMAHVLDRYRRENRALRCCEPRDLVDRARDICRFRGIPVALTQEILDVAWDGYFGASGEIN